MTYYAVTNDPNELMHFGIKGMKWGVRRTDAQLGHPKKPRSAAYKKASSKLSKMMQNGIDRTKANWREYNSPKAKYERQTNRAIEQARKGKLKYGKLTDDQVRRVTERLALERQARQLSDTEKTFRKRLSESIGTGIITGVGAGVAGMVGEKIKRKSTLKTDRLRAEQNDAFERAKEERRLRNANEEQEKKLERTLREEAAKEQIKYNAQKKTDEYEHKRDEAYRVEQARNKYLYGDGDDYYNNRYVKQQTLQEQEKQQREQERKQRLEELKAQRKEYAANVKRIEAEQKRIQEAEREQLRLAEAEAARKEHERYRKGMEELNRIAGKRDYERAIADKQRRIAEAKEKERYEHNMTVWSKDIDNDRSNVYGYEPQISYGTRTARRRRRNGSR